MTIKFVDRRPRHQEYAYEKAEVDVDRSDAEFTNPVISDWCGKWCERKWRKQIGSSNEELQNLTLKKCTDLFDDQKHGGELCRRCRLSSMNELNVNSETCGTESGYQKITLGKCHRGKVVRLDVQNESHSSRIFKKQKQDFKEMKQHYMEIKREYKKESRRIRSLRQEIAQRQEFKKHRRAFKEADEAFKRLEVDFKKLKLNEQCKLRSRKH